MKSVPDDLFNLPSVQMVQRIKFLRKYIINLRVYHSSPIFFTPKGSPSATNGVIVIRGVTKNLLWRGTSGSQSAGRKSPSGIQEQRPSGSQSGGKAPQKLKTYVNQTVNDGVAHSNNPRKCAYHVTFDLDLDLEHTLDAR